MSKIIQFGAKQDAIPVRCNLRKPRAVISIYNIKRAENPLVDEYIEIDPFDPKEWDRVANATLQASADIEPDMQDGDRVQAIFGSWILGSGDMAEFLTVEERPYGVFFRILEPSDGIGSIMPDGTFFLKIDADGIRKRGIDILGLDKF